MPIVLHTGGQLGQLAKPKGGDRISEIIGPGVALLVLLIGFGSVVAALFPLISAVIALLCGISLLGLLAAVFTFGAASLTLPTMMGLGVGLDYALFLTTRYHKLPHDSPDAATVLGRTVSTSGRAVIVAAVTVAIALAGLYASGIVFIGTLGAAAAVTVIVAAGASLTLAPALLGVVGTKIDKWHIRTPVDEPDAQDDIWARWAANPAPTGPSPSWSHSMRSRRPLSATARCSPTPYGTSSRTPAMSPPWAPPSPVPTTRSSRQCHTEDRPSGRCHC